MYLLTLAALLSSQLFNPVSSQGILDTLASLIPGAGGAQELWDILPSLSYGPCPRVPTVPGFDPARYLGAWYSQRQTPSLWSPSEQVR